MKTPEASASGVKWIPLQIFGGADFDTGARVGRDGAGTDKLPIDRCGFRLHNSANQSVHVVGQFLGAEGHLADDTADAAAVIHSVGKLAGFQLPYRIAHGRGEGTGLWRRHQPPGGKDR